MGIRSKQNNQEQQVDTRNIKQTTSTSTRSKRRREKNKTMR
jgi:hypothetical protein